MGSLSAWVARVANLTNVTYFYALPIIALIPSIVFFFLFLWEAHKSRQRMFRTLAILFAVFIVHNFFMLVQLSVVNQSLAQGAFVLSEIFFTLTLLALIFVLEMFEKNAAFSGRMT
jgi:membrane-associated HD superfamily phosphohydrolase